MREVTLSWSCPVMARALAMRTQEIVWKSLRALTLFSILNGAPSIVTPAISNSNWLYRRMQHKPRSPELNG